MKCQIVFLYSNKNTISSAAVVIGILKVKRKEIFYLTVLNSKAFMSY